MVEGGKTERAESGTGGGVMKVAIVEYQRRIDTDQNP